MSESKRNLEDAPELESKRIIEKEHVTNHQRRQELIAELQYLADLPNLSRFHYEPSGHSYLIKGEDIDLTNLMRRADILLELSKLSDNNEEYKSLKATKSYTSTLTSRLTFNNGTPEINEFEGIRRY